MPLGFGDNRIDPVSEVPLVDANCEGCCGMYVLQSTFVAPSGERVHAISVDRECVTCTNPRLR